MKILVTAFEPFGSSSVNASQEALALVDAQSVEAELIRMILPVTFEGSARLLREAVRREKPDAVLCLGEAGGRAALTPERVAVNLRDARIPDNAGAQPVDLPVEEGGPAAIFSTLPVKRMAQAISDAGLPAALSLSAGSYVCNHLMYSLLSYCQRESPQIRAGFMHLPALSPDTPGPEELARGVEAALRAVAEA